MNKNAEIVRSRLKRNRKLLAGSDVSTHVVPSSRLWRVSEVRAPSIFHTFERRAPSDFNRIRYLSTGHSLLPRGLCHLTSMLCRRQKVLFIKLRSVYMRLTRQLDLK